MFDYSFTSLVHFWPPPIFNSGYAYLSMTPFHPTSVLRGSMGRCSAPWICRPIWRGTKIILRFYYITYFYAQRLTVVVQIRILFSKWNSHTKSGQLFWWQAKFTCTWT